MTKNDILQMTEQAIISRDPRMSDPEYRKHLPPNEKQQLVVEMIQIAMILAQQAGVQI
jgi:hypothetical protein